MTHHTRWLRRRSSFAVTGLLVALSLAACAAAGGGSHLPTGDSGFAFAAGEGARTTDNGHIPDNGSVSPFDEHLPTIAKLEPQLREAVQAAAAAAEADGVEMVVTSGWRSAAYQQALLDDAIINYGSVEEARKWVSTPELSAHVTGNAVDIGYTNANSWLSQHGANFGLCQIYSNEMWHFELATEPGGICPVQQTDATAG